MIYFSKYEFLNSSPVNSQKWRLNPSLATVDMSIGGRVMHGQLILKNRTLQIG